MSHTDKAFIKAYRTASKPAPARVAIAPTSAATEPAAPLDARAPGVEPSSGSLAAPSLDAPPSPTVREFVERPAVERPRPLLARDEEAFLATGETSSPDGAPARDDASVREEASARATEPARPTLSVARLDDSSERRDSPEGDEPPATLKLTPKVEAPKLAESPAKPEPRAYLEPAESEDDSADAPASSEPTTPFVSPRGVQSLADMTQASTAVTDWGPAATVDRFEYPEVCDNLLAVAADEFSALADEIARRSQDGGKLYLAASCQGNEGATTVVLCVARTLAARGLRTVVVDQDVTHPGLAEALHLQPETGWAEVLSGEAALAEALIESEEEPLAILPLRMADSTPAIAPAARQRLCLGLLKQHFDVVLLDAGPLHLTPHEQLAQPLLDAAIIVYDPQSSADAALDDAVARLAEAKLPLAAVAENFFVEVA